MKNFHFVHSVPWWFAHVLLISVHIEVHQKSNLVPLAWLRLYQDPTIGKQSGWYHHIWSRLSWPCGGPLQRRDNRRVNFLLTVKIIIFNSKSINIKIAKVYRFLELLWRIIFSACNFIQCVQFVITIVADRNVGRSFRKPYQTGNEVVMVGGHHSYLSSLFQHRLNFFCWTIEDNMDFSRFLDFFQ